MAVVHLYQSDGAVVSRVAAMAEALGDTRVARRAATVDSLDELVEPVAKSRHRAQLVRAFFARLPDERQLSRTVVRYAGHESPLRTILRRVAWDLTFSKSKSKDIHHYVSLFEQEEIYGLMDRDVSDSVRDDVFAVVRPVLDKATNDRRALRHLARFAYRWRHEPALVHELCHRLGGGSRDSKPYYPDNLGKLYAALEHKDVDVALQKHRGKGQKELMHALLEAAYAADGKTVRSVAQLAQRYHGPSLHAILEELYRQPAKTMTPGLSALNHADVADIVRLRSKAAQEQLVNLLMKIAIITEDQTLAVSVARESSRYSQYQLGQLINRMDAAFAQTGQIHKFIEGLLDVSRRYTGEARIAMEYVGSKDLAGRLAALHDEATQTAAKQYTGNVLRCVFQHIVSAYIANPKQGRRVARTFADERIATTINTEGDGSGLSADTAIALCDALAAAAARPDAHPIEYRYLPRRIAKLAATYPQSDLPLLLRTITAVAEHEPSGVARVVEAYQRSRLAA